MVAPLIALAAGSAIAQFVNSEQARQADEKERKRLKAMLEKMQSPDFDFSQITPAEFKVVDKYVPEVARYVAEAKPEIVKETAVMGEGREAQLDALRRYRDIARAESDPAFAAQMDLAAKRAQAEAQSRQESALLAAQRRGQGGSLASLVAQLQGGSSAMDRQAEMSRQAAIEAYRNKLDAMRQSAVLGGDLRSQDIGMQRSNADIINAYNQRAASTMQNYLNQASGLRNEAQLKNLQAQQGALDANVQARNAAQVANLERANRLKQSQFDNEMAKFGGYTGQYGMQSAANRQRAQDINQLLQAPVNIASAYQDRQDAKEIARMKYGKEDDEGSIF